MITLPITIEYDPKVQSGDAEKTFKPWWVIGVTIGDLSDYYAWFIRKHAGITIQEPAWGAHISIVRGEEPIDKLMWNKHHGETVCVDLDIYIRSNGTHWWMPVKSSSLEDIRTGLGLSPKARRKDGNGFMELHLTIGSTVPNQRDIGWHYSTEK